MNLRKKLSDRVFGFQEIDLTHQVSFQSAMSGTVDPPAPELTEDEKYEAEAKTFDLSKALKNPKIAEVIKGWAEREVVAPIKGKNNELLEKLTRYKYKDGDGKEHYLDPDEAKVAIEKVKSGTPVEVQKEVDRAVEAANSRNKVIIDNLNSQRTNLEEQLNKERSRRLATIIDNELSRALATSGIKPGKMHLHEMYLRNYLRVAEENGKEVLVVLDEADREKPRYGSKGLMTVQEFILEYRNRDGVAEDWMPTVRGGSGTQPGMGGGRTGVSINQDLPPAERLKIARAVQAGTMNRR